MRILFLSVALSLSLGGFSPANANAWVTIFAASSTQHAVDALLDECSKVAETQCRAVYAASSTLARQIANGAPADIYISANTRWMDYLIEEKIADADTVKIIATNSLVVIASAKQQTLIRNEKELIDWLASDRIGIGDPAHVPAGIYAKQALSNSNTWERLRPQILAMPNVRAALAVVARDEASAGVVYASDVHASDAVSVVYKFSNDLHEPIVYPIARINGDDRPEVERAYAFLTSVKARDTFRAAGFVGRE